MALVLSTKGKPSEANFAALPPDVGTPMVVDRDTGECYIMLTNGTIARIGGNDFVTPYRYGAVGDGSTDDAAALRQAFQSGKPVSLAGGDFAFGSQIAADNDEPTIIGPGTLSMLTGTGQFTNTDPVTKFASNSCGIYIENYDKAFLYNFKIRLVGTPSEDNIVVPIAVRDSSASRAEWVEITAFKKTTGLFSVDTCLDCDFVHNYLHDCSTNGASNGQLSGFTVDDNRISGGSERLNISFNKIRDLTVGASFLAAFGYQTDGINLQGPGNSIGHTVIGNQIDNVGECIDIFSSYCTVQANVCLTAYAIGIKMIHGASFNNVGSNIIDAPGKSGMEIHGSDTAGFDTDGNNVHDNIITRVNLARNWDASTTAGILVDDVGRVYLVRRTTLKNNHVLNSADANFAFTDSAMSADNVWTDNRAPGTFRNALLSNISGAWFSFDQRGASFGTPSVPSTILLLASSTASMSSFRIPHGVDPTNPVNGDCWTLGSGAFMRINGVTRQVQFV